MITPLSFDAALEQYQQQSDSLLEAHHAGDSETLRIIHQTHPRFLDSKVKWLPKNLTAEDIQRATFDAGDAQLTLARWYNFLDWASLSKYVNSVSQKSSDTFLFESAVEAVVNGGEATLEARLRDHPQLIQARSQRVNNFDPPVHRATLLHYIAANGVEGYRQKTPPNAVAIASALLQAGAEVDALANMYGGECTTMSMLVSSCHPAKAGLQVALVETLLDFGASPNESGKGNSTSPVMTALVFGHLDAAEALVRRGARIDKIELAAGLGRLADVEHLLPNSDANGRHRALAIAVQLGYVDVVCRLLDAGEDPNRYNPDGFHSHSTPLHQAIFADHLTVAKLLVERGARTNIKDTIYHGTALGWAQYCKKPEIEKYLLALGAK